MALLWALSTSHIISDYGSDLSNCESQEFQSQDAFDFEKILFLTNHRGPPNCISLDRFKCFEHIVHSCCDTCVFHACPGSTNHEICHSPVGSQS